MKARCACGQAQITLAAKPFLSGVCHCTNCKRRTGSAFGMSMYFEKSAIVSQTGETKTYAFHYAELKHDQARHFCTHCGATLFWFTSNMPEKIGVAGGCFDPDDIDPPNASYRDSQRCEWVTFPQSWQRFPAP